MELMAIVRALHLGALALLAGAFAFPLLVVRAASVPGLDAWLARVRAASAVLALLTWIAWLGPVAAGMSGLPPADAWQPSVLKVVLVQTRFGHVWLTRLALLVALALVARRTSWLAIALTAAVLVAQAWAGHATAGPLSHVAVDAAHLVAAALWVGSLPPLLWAVARARSGDAAYLALASRAARGFTHLGLIAVVVLAVTGFLNGRMMLGSVEALFTTTYGELVAAKLVLFVAMLVLAAINRFRLTPRLAAGEPHAGATARRLWRSVAAEAALGACIFAIVGALGGTAPAAHGRSDAMPSHQA